MSIIVSDPTRWFVFRYPTYLASDEESFESKYPSPYHYINEVDAKRFLIGFGGKDFYDFDDFFLDSTTKYHLPYQFDTQPINIYPNEIGEYTEFTYIHTIRDMTKKDVSQSFFSRAVYYFEKDDLNNLLEKQYGSYRYDLLEWLDNLQNMLIEEDECFDRLTPTLFILKLKKFIADWITQKRKELAELTTLTVNIEEPTNTLATLTNPLSTEEPTDKTTTQTTSQRFGEPISNIDFFVIIYVLGKLGVVETFIANGQDGCSSKKNKEKVKSAANWAMKKWGLEFKISTLQDYTKNSLKEKKRRKKFPKIISFLENDYPTELATIKSILAEFEPKE